MKNVAIIVVLLLTGHSVTAQLKTGESFFGGSVYFNFKKMINNDQDARYDQYYHDINMSIGRFVKNNKAVGWGLTHTLSIQKLENFNITPKPLRNIGFGGQRFWEFYKPINNKFSLYLRPTLGLSIELRNDYSINDNENRISAEINTKKLELGVGLGAGVAWRLTPKWALYGGFAMSNPLNISTSFIKETNLEVQNQTGENLRIKNTAFDYQFAPTISSGGISLGFRYFY
jgi:hypothetical protein